jgi:Na+:H+ antiporter, NhaA family
MKISAALTGAVTRGSTGASGRPGRDRVGMPTERTPGVEPLDEAVDHVRGEPGGAVIIEYGDYQCPYSRRAFRSIQRVERRAVLRCAFRHFPLTEIHPHALGAAAAAEAAALQDRFWEMHELLFHRQNALDDSDLRRYAGKLDLDLERFDADRSGADVPARIERDVRSALATGEVHGTPTLFINGVVHRGEYDPATLLEALSA